MKNTTSQKNVTVSIILSESTASLLNLNVPHLSNSLENSETSICSIKAIEKIEERDLKRNLQKYFFTDKKPQNESLQISKEIAYFSKRIHSNSSVDITDDLSDISIDNVESGDKLDIMQVYTRPIVSVKTEAHCDNLSARNNKLYLKLTQSELSITHSGWINVCRICYGGKSSGDLLAPCRCKGSVALAHLSCLERWLKESASSRCELCQHHFDIIREPIYSVPLSIFVFLRHPGEHYKELLLDLLAFIVYTPSACASTYMLMLLCESIAKANIQYTKNISSHVMAFSAIFGIATIDFTYSSWLIMTLQKHVEAWKIWYKNKCQLRLILPSWKTQRHRKQSEHK